MKPIIAEIWFGCRSIHECTECVVPCYQPTRHIVCAGALGRVKTNPISRFDKSCAQAHWVRSKPILRVLQLKLHKPTMAIGNSLRSAHVQTTCRFDQSRSK